MVTSNGPNWGALESGADTGREIIPALERPQSKVTIQHPLQSMHGMVGVMFPITSVGTGSGPRPKGQRAENGAITYKAKSVVKNWHWAN